GARCRRRRSRRCCARCGRISTTPAGPSWRRRWASCAWHLMWRTHPKRLDGRRAQSSPSPASGRGEISSTGDNPMLKTWINSTLRALLGLVVLGAAGLALGAYLGDRKTMRHVDVAVQPVTIPTDAASLEHGRYLYATRGCADCHGPDGAGRAFVNDGGLY